MLKHITAAVVIGLTLAGPVAAQTRQRPDVRTDRPKSLLAQRIHQGIRSGQLTRPEVREIRQRLQALRSDVKRMRADGTLSKADRQALRQEWRRVSRLVFVKKHR
jgi:hypothetical protein